MILHKGIRSANTSDRHNVKTDAGVYSVWSFSIREHPGVHLDPPPAVANDAMPASRRSGVTVKEEIKWIH